MPDVHYRSAVRPQDDGSDDRPTTLMVGIVRRIRREDLDTRDPEALMASVEEGKHLWKPRLLSDGTLVEPDPTRPLERFDVYAAEGNDEDILVMWRVPMRVVSKK